MGCCRELTHGDKAPSACVVLTTRSHCSPWEHTQQQGNQQLQTAPRPSHRISPTLRAGMHSTHVHAALPYTTQEQGTPSTAPGPPTAPSTVPHLEPSARPQPRAHTGLLCTQTADIWKSLNIKIYSSVKAENNPCLAHDVALAFVSLNQC